MENSKAQLFEQSLTEILKNQNENKKISPSRLNRAITAALLKVMCNIAPRKADRARAAYFSAEFLPGSFTLQNLAALGLEKNCREVLKKFGLSINELNSLPDPALGNGGLGRLASCLLDSAAVCDIPLDGYGIRYKYGLFRQRIENNSQSEQPDDWHNNCPFEKEQREQAQTVCFGDFSVLAVPFDVPIAGKNCINRLRLWQCEPLCAVDFKRFAKGEFTQAFEPQTAAEAISAFLYPPDETEQGKILRLRQQYFFTAASLGSILSDFKKTGKKITDLSDFIRIQLNDTHPAVAVLELLRRLCEEYFLDFEVAFSIINKIFSYTNHTVMAEALEKWDISLFCKVLPHVYPYAVMLHNLSQKQNNSGALSEKTAIISNGRIAMANLAIFASHKINGVAKIHTDILKENVFAEQFKKYPDRFLNITNGISQRRWLELANPELCDFFDERLSDDWRGDLTQLERVSENLGDSDLSHFCEIKHEKKKQLCDWLKGEYNISADPEFMFSVQVKRIHEYKRQLLNILNVLGLYLDIKQGSLKDFYPTVFLFAGKAAPSYYRAKEIIRLINSTGRLIEQDSAVRKLIKVVFVPDYNVKSASKIIPAADLSEQLSTAGTEASGTGNMKLSLNGAPTIGTLDGATIEIVQYAGKENNYIFGATKDEVEAVNVNYDPMNIYYTNDRISRIVDLLKNGPAGDFESLFKSLLFGSDYEPADRYKVLMDYPSYNEARIKANEDYKNSRLYAEKSLANISGASHFSSDETIRKYNRLIWKV